MLLLLVLFGYFIYLLMLWLKVLYSGVFKYFTMSSLVFFKKKKKPGCFELCMRDGVNCLSTQIRSVVGCLNVVFTCFAAQNIFWLFCIRVLFSILLLSFTSMSSSLWIWQGKKIGVFCRRDILNNGYTKKSINRFFTAGYFVTGIYLNRVISYYLIVQSRFFKGHFDLGYSVAGLFYTC
jgi:hypothetical protein